MSKSKKRINKKKPFVIAMVPAKLGSTRLPMKNLALLNGKPLVYYPIKAARDSGAFNHVVINAEDELFSRVAKRYKVDFYKRPNNLVRRNTKTDEVVYDFLLKNPCDIVAWVSPIVPFQTKDELKSIVNYFVKNNLDSLMTVKSEKLHAVYNGKPVNFKLNEIFAQTQDLKPIESMVYSVMMWRADTFLRTFKKKGYALLSGKVGFYPVSKASAIIIKKKEDLILAEGFMRSMSKIKSYKVRYDKLTKEV